MLTRNILRDPILHLFVVCTGIITLHYYNISSIPKRETIVVDDEMAERAISQIQYKLDRHPTEAEWKELLNRQILQEIVHRESLAENQENPYHYLQSSNGKRTQIIYTEYTGQAYTLKVFHNLKKQYRIEFKISNRDLCQQLEANFPVAFKK